MRLNPKLKFKPTAPISDLQSNCMNCLQEILGRLDDLQKLRSIIDIENRTFKRDIINLKTFKNEIENLCVLINLNEQLRITKENNNLSLLCKFKENDSNKPTYLCNKSTRFLSTSKVQLKLDGRKSYISSINSNTSCSNLISQNVVLQNVERSHSINKNENSIIISNTKSKSPSNNQYENDKTQQEACIRRFMKKIVSRIIKRIFFMLSTSKVEDSICLRDFSEFNLFQIMEEKLPLDSNKKVSQSNPFLNHNCLIFSKMVEAGMKDKSIDCYYVILLCCNVTRNLFNKEFIVCLEIIDSFFQLTKTKMSPKMKQCFTSVINNTVIFFD